mmetsp:Transcript_19546/g.45402  ORF Transcript_19546/g.45402 Transcript_19546/m.45402 type:complete len:201 (+) Transcript_19546:1069-1671(+)
MISSLKFVKERPYEAGNLPPKVGIPTIDKCSRPVSSLRFVGISPVKRFGPRESEVKEDRFVIASGTTPPNLFPPMDNSVSGNRNKIGGTAPAKPFDSMLRTFKPEMFCNCSRGPLRLFDATLICVSFVFFDVTVGSAPDSVLPLKLTEVKLLLVKKDSQMEPTKKFFATENSSIALSKLGTLESGPLKPLLSRFTLRTYA